jgi:hypothetical protein
VRTSVQLALASVALAFGCAFGAEPAAAPPAPDPFSGERAFAHLEKLVALGPRVAGSAGAAAARALVAGELEALGLPVHEDAFEGASAPGEPPLALANLWTETPGTETGLFVVATPLDTAPGAGAGANEGGSGTALLLELARTLVERPLAYPVRLLFLDAELLDPQRSFLGSQRAHDALRESGALERLRLLLYLHQVGDRELEIRRDRRSDRGLRDLVFAVARRRGFADAFPSAAPYEDVRLGHLVFSERRFSGVVALADLRYGGDQVPGEHWRVEDHLANCAPESLAAVGSVVRAALEAIAERQLTVDRLTRQAPGAEESHPPAPAAP